LVALAALGAGGQGFNEQNTAKWTGLLLLSLLCGRIGDLRAAPGTWCMKVK